MQCVGENGGEAVPTTTIENIRLARAGVGMKRVKEKLSGRTTGV